MISRGREGQAERISAAGKCRVRETRRLYFPRVGVSMEKREAARERRKAFESPSELAAVELELVGQSMSLLFAYN